MDQKRLDLIDEYLLGRLKDAELNSFESTLKVDAELQSAVDQRRLLIKYIINAENRNLSTEVKQVHKIVLEEKKSHQEKRRIGLWLTAVFLILGLAWMAYNILNTKPNDNELYVQYYAVKEISFGLRNVDTIHDIRLIEAGNYYEHADYSKALTLFQEILANRTDVKIQLAVGLCHLQLMQPKAALEVLQSIIDAQDPVYTDDAIWYAALSNLLLNKNKEAKDLLAPLSQRPNSYYRERARQLIGQL